VYYKYASFVRQLNLHGFRKLRSKPRPHASADGEWSACEAFVHRLFQRDHPELYHLIEKEHTERSPDHSGVDKQQEASKFGNGVEVVSLGKRRVAEFAARLERQNKVLEDFAESMELLDRRDRRMVVAVLDRLHKGLSAAKNELCDSGLSVVSRKEKRLKKTKRRWVEVDKLIKNFLDSVKTVLCIPSAPIATPGCQTGCSTSTSTTTALSLPPIPTPWTPLALRFCLPVPICVCDSLEHFTPRSGEDEPTSLVLPVLDQSPQDCSRSLRPI